MIWRGGAGRSFSQIHPSSWGAISANAEHGPKSPKTDTAGLPE
jgi:hypothetical protein